MTDIFRRQIDQYRKSLIEAQCAGDRKSEARALSRLGEVYIGLGENEQACGYIQNALNLARLSGATQVVGLALANLGLLHIRRGETRKAALCYLEALEAVGAVSDLHTQFAILDSLIEIYQETNEPDKIAICAEHKLIIEERAKSQIPEGQATDETGWAFEMSGNQYISNGLAQVVETDTEDQQHETNMVGSTEKSSILSNLVGGTAFTGFGRFSSIIFSFINVFLVTRALSAGDYGSFVILRLVVIFLGQVSGFGLNSALPVFISEAQDADEKRRIFNTVLYSRLLIVIICSAVAIPLRVQIAALFGASIEPDLVLFIPVWFLFEVLLTLMQSVLQSFLQFARIGISDFIVGLANLLFMIVFVLWLRLGFIGLVYARCVALFIALVFTFIDLPVQVKLEFDFAILRKLLKFGIPLQLNNVLSFIFGRIDTMLIGLLLGAEGVAYYEIARKIPDSLNIGFEAYRIVYYPYVSRFYAQKQHGRLAKLLNNSNRLIAFVTLLGALVTLLFGHELVFLFFTSKYEASVSPLIVLMVGLCFSMIGYTLGTSLVAIGDTVKPPLINLAHMAVTIGGNLLLIPHLGITGAALTVLVGNIVTNPLNVYFLRRRDIAVDTKPYVKAMMIFTVHAVVYLTLLPTSLWIRSLFFIPFLLSSIFFSVITETDFRLLIDATRPLVSQALNAVRTR